jgi:dihydropyrimidinase
VSTTLIRNGLVITAAEESRADVLIEDETVVALAATGSSLAQAWTADTEIDADGCYVVPGGVDGHTHMEMPFGGTTASDTFETGTRAAAWGGTTTVVDFAIQPRGGALRAGLDDWHAKADGNCAIDYAFHMIMSDVNEGSLKEMEALVGEGVTSFKLFMAYPGVLYSDDGQILRALQRGAETGGLILMHAENGIAIDVLIEQALARGETDPRYHGIVRHELLEAEATHRAIKLAQVANAPIYIVHLSAEKALAEVARARDDGWNAFAETCPQYLFLSSDDLARPGFEGAKYVCSTPLRPQGHQAALWRGLRTNDLSVVSTDHCPFCFKPQKELGLLQDPERAPGRRAPDGPAALGRRRRAHHPASLGRAGVRDPGADVRPLPAQGHHRPGQRRGRRRLRPERLPGALGQHAPHERRLLLLRGADAARLGPDGAVPRAGGRRPRRVHGVGRARALRQARHVPVPGLGAHMDVGLVLQTDPPGSATVDLLVRAEELGFSHGWVFDSHVLWQEPYVILSQVLARTSRLVVGPMVTNPATRDWSVVASLHATLNEMHGDRTVCGIGRGDSAVRVQGRRPTTLARLEGAVHVIRELASGRPVDVEGTEVRIPWVRAGSSLPVWVAGYGPKALELTGRCADGFILQLADPYLVEWTVKSVRAAAEAAGRDPDALTICVAAPAYVTDGSAGAAAHAREQCRWFGGMVGNHVADLVNRYGESGAVPTELTAYIRDREGYDYSHHGKAGNPSTTFVPDDVVDRFCLLGPPSAQLERLAELRELGVDQFAVYAMHDAREATIEEYGRSVIPQLG